MKEILNEKIETLEEILIELERIVVAFSGGVDSSFLLKIGTNTLGNNCIAVILKTHYMNMEVRFGQNNIDGRCTWICCRNSSLLYDIRKTIRW